MGKGLRTLSWDEAVELGSPYPYVLAVSVDEEGRPNIIGLGWWTFASWDPPQVAISVGRERYSHHCIQHCGEFVLCFPSAEQKEAAWFCGRKSGRHHHKFEETGLTAVPAHVVQPPLIEGSTVAYECRVVDRLEGNDHTLFLADILAIHGTPEKSRHLYSIHYRKLISLDHRDFLSRE